MNAIDRIENWLDTIKNIIRYPLKFLYRLSIFITSELRNPVRLSMFHTFRALKHGFFTYNYRLYGLESSGNPRDFISDYIQMVKIPDINGEYGILLNNKVVFTNLMHQFNMPTPKILGMIQKGILCQTDTYEEQKWSDFTQSMNHEETYVLKPVNGFHGDGVMILQKNHRRYMVNGNDMELPELSTLLSALDSYFISEFITQCVQSAALFPDTVNTVRLLTCLNVNRGSAFIAGAVQRIGTSRSYPVDNFKAGLGGLSAPVDLESGLLGRAASASKKAEVTWHARHPETGAQIQGVPVHNWEEIKADILGFAKKMVFTPYIAWDVVPTEKRYCVIEANRTPGAPVMQVHGPMLVSKALREFYKHHHIIK